MAVTTILTPKQPPTADAAALPRPLGRLPWTLLAIAAGLAIMSVADALSRTGRSGGAALFWPAIALIFLPAAVRLCGERARPTERLATVVAVGMGMYAVKVLRDPFAFTYGDEFSHLYNLQSILASGRLFGSNPVLPVTPNYPGLETVAALVVRAGGLSSFAAGVTTIAAGRLLLMLALYVLYDRLTGSPRAAGLGALVYAATPNFLFWSAQFAYESLALPLATVALFLAIRWAQEHDPQVRRSWEAAFGLTAAAVVVTHHVSAYVLVALLVAICLIHWRLHGRRGAPWVLAAIAALLTLLWLGLAASNTVGYLSPVLTSAFNQVVQTLTSETGTRALFANQGGAEVTPPAEIVVALFGIVLLALGVLMGILRVWNQRRRNPVLVLLVVCSVGYLAILPVRLVPAAWETAERAGDFLFIGVGLTVAIGLAWLLDRMRGRLRWKRLLLASGLTIVFASGVIAGWPANQRVADPSRVVVDGRTLDPPSLVAAEWSGRTLGPGLEVGAHDADALFFLDYGHEITHEGAYEADVNYLLDASTLQPAVTSLLGDFRLALVVTDRRNIADDNLFGFFFDERAPSLSPAGPADKFNVPAANRLYDDGDRVIYGVRALW
jgi:hypothetical protein